MFASVSFFHKKSVRIMISSLTAAIINLILNYVCIIKFGYIAAGYTTLVCYIAYTLFHYFAFANTCRKHGIDQLPYNTKLFLLVSVILLAVGLSAMALYNMPLIRYMLIGILVVAAVFRREKIISIYREIKSGRK